MTAITALITKTCTVHAADSLVTIQREKDTYVPDDWNFRKIVRVEGEFWGAMSFWGYASADIPSHNYSWSTPAWLAKRAAAVANQSAEEFANNLARDLQSELNKVQFIDQDGNERPLAKGLGIHFTAYEYVDGRWIPELFLITNWTSLPYTSVDSKKIHVSRETYSILERAMNKGVMITSPETHGSKECRLFVHQYLQASDSNWFIFNNGDPEMFGAFARGIHQGYRIVSRRGGLKNKDSAETYRKLAELPIKLIAETQSRFCADGTQLIGGRVHNLSIEPGSRYQSDTGD